MKYYKQNNEVFAYEEDGSQDHLIGDKVLMTAEEVEAHINPPKTEAQILAEKVAEAKAYLASTDWVEPYLIKHYTGIIVLEADSSKFAVEAKRGEVRAFLKEQGL